VSSSSENPQAGERTVSLVTLGCARNEVDSEELAGRLDAAGWTVAGDGDAGQPDVVLVNTCAFIEAAKQESIAELLDAASGSARVVAVGCLAERYGSQLAEALPEAQVLSFDDYGDIAARLDAVLAGERLPAHEPRDRRRLLPLAPAGRPAAPPPTSPATACRIATCRAPPAPSPICRRERRPHRARGPCGAGWTAGLSRHSRSLPDATAGAASARSRPSVARSFPVRRRT
jgi:hypothetical protein